MVAIVGHPAGFSEGGPGRFDASEANLARVLVEAPFALVGFDEDQLCFHGSQYAEGV